MKMTFQEIRIIATAPCIANQLRDVNTICRRSWYIAAHIWKIYDFKIEVVPLIINFSTELTTVVKFEVWSDYLMKNNVVLDFSKMTCNLNSANVQTQRRLNLDPNTETIVWARVPNYVTIGLQGVCSKSKFSCGKGLLVAKSVVTVSNNQKVPVKLLNPTNETIVIQKGAR